MIDQRAKKILFDTFWTSTGWRPKSSTPPEDFEHAKSKGLMFDPVSFTHDDEVQYALRARNAIEQHRVVKAFIASLTTRRLDLRSGLGSYAVVRHLNEHGFDGSFGCNICGSYASPTATDLNVLNFERHKWGGVRHSQPVYIGFDLAQLHVDQEIEPSAHDYETLNAILSTARSMPLSSRLKDLSKAIAGLFPSNDAERRTLLGILGYCGILADDSKPGFRKSFVRFDHRTHTRYAKDDWPYPVQWWTGRHGVNEDAVADWFPASKN